MIRLKSINLVVGGSWGRDQIHVLFSHLLVCPSALGRLAGPASWVLGGVEDWEIWHLAIGNEKRRQANGNAKSGKGLIYRFLILQICDFIMIYDLL